MGHFLLEAILSVWEVNPRTPSPKTNSSPSSQCGMASAKAVSENKLQYWTRKLRTQLNDVRDAVGDDGLLVVLERSLRKEELRQFVALAALPIEKGEKMKAQVAELIAERSSGSRDMEKIVVPACQDTIGGHEVSKRLLRVPGKKRWFTVKTHKVAQASCKAQRGSFYCLLGS